MTPPRLQFDPKRQQYNTGPNDTLKTYMPIFRKNRNSFRASVWPDRHIAKWGAGGAPPEGVFNPPAPCLQGSWGVLRSEARFLLVSDPLKSPGSSAHSAGPCTIPSAMSSLFHVFFSFFFGTREITQNIPHGATQKATKTVLPALWSHYKKQRLSRCCFSCFLSSLGRPEP